MDQLFRQYDVRGKVTEDLTPDFAKYFGVAYAKYCKKKLNKKALKISVGHDARHSSLPLFNAFSEGLQSENVEIYYLGLVTSPLVYFSAFHFDELDGAVVITGSHNPPEYNGFKICLEKSSIHSEEIQEIKMIFKDVYQKALSSGIGTIIKKDIIKPYVEHYSKQFKFKEPHKVVLDCGNGAAGVVAKSLFEASGLVTEVLFEKPDGDFPNHHPDPTIEKNLKDVRDYVLKNKLNVGFAFDGDADRIGLVDDMGNMIFADDLMALLAIDVYKKSPNAHFVGDVKCSDRMYDFIEKLGAQTVMWKTGHSLIKQKIKDVDAPFGGELSGHIFFRDRNFGFDDGLYAALRLVEVLDNTGLKISELLKDYPESFSTPELRVEFHPDEVESILEEVINLLKNDDDIININEIDGIRARFDEGWILARASNTQPAITFRFESTTKEGLNRLITKMPKRYLKDEL